MSTIFEEYAILDAEEKALKVKKEDLRVKVLKNMVDRGVNSEVFNLGSFSISNLKKWNYSEDVTNLNEEWKTLKAKEESAGIATYTEEASLRFNQIKL